jgi:hypothetical protein
VAHRAIDIEPLASAPHHRLVDGIWEFRRIRFAGFAGKAGGIIAQLASGNGAEFEGPVGLPVGEKLARLIGLVITGLSGHLLAVAAGA